MAPSGFAQAVAMALLVVSAHAMPSDINPSTDRNFPGDAGAAVRTTAKDTKVVENATSTSSYLRGIDVSHYQGTIDWSKVAASGLSFAMTKATEGTGYVDPMFAVNFEGIQDVGMVRGAYHFAHPSEDANAQAEFFVSTVNATSNAFNHNTMQLVLDLEDSDGLSSSAVWAWVQTFVAKIKVLTGRPCTIYTGYYFWNDNVGAPTNNLDCPLWIASYTSPNPVGTPTAWSSVGWAFWQYDDNGATSPGGAAATVPGISGNVDVDYFQNGGAYPSLSGLCYN